MSATSNMWEKRLVRWGGGVGGVIDRSKPYIINISCVLVPLAIVASFFYILVIPFRTVTPADLEKILKGPDACLARELKDEIATASRPLKHRDIEGMEKRCENNDVLQEQKRVLK